MRLKTIPDRIVLFSRDIGNITGLSLRSCQRLIQKIREANGKSGHGFITLQEFCSYCELKEEDIKQYLKI